MNHTIPHIFVGALILLVLGASVTYAITGDIRRSVYWFAAATLTICVTL